MARRSCGRMPTRRAIRWKYCPSPTRSAILRGHCAGHWIVGIRLGTDLAGEDIAHAAHRADQQRFVVARVDLAAQAGDMTIDRPVERRPGLTAQREGYLVTAEPASGMTDKELQKAQFGVGEVDGATIEFAHEAPAGVEHAMIEIQQMGQVGAAV